MSNFSGQYSLLWSKSQNALHVEPVEHTLSVNRQRYLADKAVHDDYIPISFGTRVEVDAEAEVCKGLLSQRERSGK